MAPASGGRVHTGPSGAGHSWGAERTPRVARSPARPVHGVSGSTGGGRSPGTQRPGPSHHAFGAICARATGRKEEQSPGRRRHGTPWGGHGGPRSASKLWPGSGLRPGQVASWDPCCLPGPGDGWGRSVLIPAWKRDSGVSWERVARRRRSALLPKWRRRPAQAGQGQARARSGAAPRVCARSGGHSAAAPSAPVPAGRDRNPNPNPSRAKAGDGVSAFPAL